MLVAAVPAPESFSGDIQADILVTFLVILNTSVIFIALGKSKHVNIEPYLFYQDTIVV